MDEAPKGRGFSWPAHALTGKCPSLFPAAAAELLPAYPVLLCCVTSTMLGSLHVAQQRHLTQQQF